MKLQIGILLLGLSGLAFGQSAETRVYRAVLSPLNENPPITGLNASGSGTVYVHAVKDAQGQITSGTVDFVTNYIFPTAITITGMHIHAGAAGVNGGVTVDSGIRAPDTVTNETGRGTLTRTGQVTSAAGLATLNGIWSDPSQYYLNVHTTVNTGGAIRGQLVRAETVTVAGFMSPANENPPVASAGSAFGVVTANVTRDAAGNLTSGEVVFDVDYDFGAQVTFTGLHIHTGARGVNGPVTLNSGMTGQNPSDPSGRGKVQYRNQMDVANAATANALNGIFFNPSGYYINIHTTIFGGGIARDQVRRMDSTEFQVNLSPANEVPAIAGLDASAPSAVTIRTLRRDDGTAQAAYVTFDVNHRFPGDTTFRGLHVHDGPAGVNGPVRLDSGLNATNTVRSESGFGNIYATFLANDANSLATVNSLLANPHLHYLNLHTTVNTGGAVRAQLGAVRSGTPIVGAVISAADQSISVTGNGGLISIYGANFANVEGNLSGWSGDRAPTSFNGITATLNGTPMPLVYVSSSHINAQIPFDAAPGTGQLVITVGGGAASQAFPIQVATAAPSIFTYYPDGGVVYRASDLSLITTANPARAGDSLLVYSTGNGQASQALQTGVLPPSSPLATVSGVTASLGGQTAQVTSSAATPGMLGVYQTTIVVPSGLAAGSARLTLSVGGRTSNAVNIAVQ